MTAFVEECRQEWKRLGVPDRLAEEMANELESDLAEAQADGVSAAELLGESDPRRFAATWARERGLVPEPAPQKRKRRVWPWLVGGFAGLFVLLLIWLALQTVGSSGSSAPPLEVTPAQRVSVPNVVGMKACKAVRTVAHSGVDDWRILGHPHGYNCDLVVVAQLPAPGQVVRRNSHPVRVTLQLGRS